MHSLAALMCLQALITGREGGPQQVLQRAHTTMQALVSAEEILRRARERAGQAAQQVQRIARTEQQNQQLRDELQQQLRESNQRHAQIQQEQAELAQTVREVMARQGAAGRAAAPAGGAAASGRQQQQGAAGAQGMDGVAANVAAVAQQLMAGLGMSPVEQHDMLARVGGPPIFEFLMCRKGCLERVPRMGAMTCRLHELSSIKCIRCS